MDEEHRGPIAALLIVLAFACVVMVNGVREQVADAFVVAGGPPPLVGAVVPDILLMRSALTAGPPSTALPDPVTPSSDPPAPLPRTTREVGAPPAAGDDRGSEAGPRPWRPGPSTATVSAAARRGPPAR